MDNKLQEALKMANDEIQKVKIDDPELKKIAFSKAVDFYLYSTEHSQLNQKKSICDNSQEINDPWGRLTLLSGIEIKKLKDIYSIDGGQIRLVLSSVSGDSRVEKQRNLAALILFAYHEGLGKEWVSASFIAEAASHSNLYDTSKFAKNLKFDWFRSYGVKKGLKYKLSGPGINYAKKFLVDITK